MSIPSPTPHSFFAVVTSPAKQNKHLLGSSASPSSSDISLGDGFTSSERLRDVTLTPGEWTPRHDYEEVSIGGLSPGPRWVSFSCRIVNIFDQNIESKMPQAAKGCLKLLVRDDRATILIKLWYATTTYQVRLGTLLTFWTSHISSTASISGLNEILATPPSTLLTSVFPERDTGCYVQIHCDEGEVGDVYRTPPGYVNGQTLPGLMSLDIFANGGGDEIPEATLLVCVTAIGEPITVTTKTGFKFMTLEVGICDQSAQATLSLSIPLFASALSWAVHLTVLFISHPKLRAALRLSITSRSLIDVDPDIAEAVELRRYVQRENCAINQPFPEGIFDLEAIMTSPLRIQFTFRTFSELVSSRPDQIIGGYISVILSEVNLVNLYNKKQIFCMECCNMPAYFNSQSRRCGQCGKCIHLRINPNLVGEMADETGAVGPATLNGHKSNAPVAVGPKTNMKKYHSKILWTDTAWVQLLGRSIEDFASLCRDDVPAAQRRDNANLLRYLEDRLKFMRVICVIGWTGDFDGGRLAVLSIIA